MNTAPDRFTTPLPKTKLNTESILNEADDENDKKNKSKKSREVMKQYFDTINKSYHLSGQGDELHLESESFTQEFSMPPSYDHPNCNLSQVSPEKARIMPEKVLFYMFYNLPFERAQLTAANELKSRRWSYSSSIMCWIKVAPKTKKTHDRKSPS